MIFWNVSHLQCKITLMICLSVNIIMLVCHINDITRKNFVARLVKSPWTLWRIWIFFMLPYLQSLVWGQSEGLNETLFAVWKHCSLCGEIDCLYILLMICPLPSVLVRRKAGQHPQGWRTHISVSYYIPIAILSLLFIASFSTTEKSQYSET